MIESLTIRKRSHHFLILNPSDAVRRVIREFVAPFIEWDYRMVGGRRIKEMGSVYWARNKSATEYRFHISLLPKFIQLLNERGIATSNIKFYEDRPSRGAKVEFDMHDYLQPREHQIDPLKYLHDNTEPRVKLLGLQTGQGKAGWVGSKIQTPNGPITHGTAKVGDVIYKPDGETTTITGVFPQGKHNVYRISTEQDRETLACGDHLWRVAMYYEPGQPIRWELATTVELARWLEDDVPVAIPFYSPHPDTVDFKDIEPITQLYGLDESALRVSGHLTLDVDKVETLRQYLFSKGYSVYVKPDHDVETIVKVYWDTIAPEVIQVLDIVSDRVDHVTCIEVDSPEGLYLTDDWLVTHNTYTTLKYVKDVGRRAMYFMPAKYLHNWEKACKETYVSKDKNTLFVIGNVKLRKLIRDAKAGKPIPYNNIIVSSNTYGAFIKQWEREPKKFKAEYQIHPDQIWRLLGIDTVVIDEAHEMLHFNYKLFMYLNIYKSISLSATYDPSHAFREGIQRMLHPLDSRFDTGEYNKYTTAASWTYEIRNPDRVRITEVNDDKYSHNAFERYTFSNKERRERYFEMIYEMLRVEYLEKYQDKESCLIFCASVDLCKELANYIRKRHPDKHVTHFVAGGDFTEEFLKADIVVSTVGKTGAAVDKPGLLTVICTVAMDSIVTFKQVYGRAREIKGRTTRFAMLTAINIPKQKGYLDSKLKVLPDMSVALHKRHYPKSI